MEVGAVLDIIVRVIVITGGIMIVFARLWNKKNRRKSEQNANTAAVSPESPSATAATHSSQPQSAAKQFNIQRNLPNERKQGRICNYTINGVNSGEQWQGYYESSGFLFFTRRVFAVKNVQTGVEYSVINGDLYESQHGGEPQRKGRFRHLHDYIAFGHLNGMIHNKNKVDGDFFITIAENKNQCALIKYSSGDDKFRENRNFNMILSGKAPEYILLLMAIARDNIAGYSWDGLRPYSTTGQRMVKIKTFNERDGHSVSWLPEE